MQPPQIDLPERPKRAEVLYAAYCADIYVEQLTMELMDWTDKTQDLLVRADALKER